MTEDEKDEDECVEWAGEELMTEDDPKDENTQLQIILCLSGGRREK